MFPHRALAVSLSVLLASLPALAQAPPAPGGNRAAQFAITQRLNLLRDLDTKKRGKDTRDLAGEIRKLPPGRIRLSLATALAKLALEDDFGDDTFRAAADTLSDALGTELVSGDKARLAGPLTLLAQFARYENIPVTLDNPLYTAALAQLDATGRQRELADFTLPDTDGKTWTRTDLAGKVFVFHFFATAQPNVRQELSDLEKVYRRFEKRNCIVLAITDESADVVRPFLGDAKITYPVLLDTDRKASFAFHVQSTPCSLIFDGSGKLVGQTLGRRSEKRYRALLSQADMK